MTLATGEKLTADIVVAADGIHSLGVETILGRPNPPLPQTPCNGCYRFLIATADLAADPATAFWHRDGCRDGVMDMYLGGKKGHRLVGYPCREYVSYLPFFSSFY